MTTPLIEPTTVAQSSLEAEVLDGLWEEAIEEQIRLRPKRAAPDSDPVSQKDQAPRPGRATTLRARFAHD